MLFEAPALPPATSRFTATRSLSEVVSVPTSVHQAAACKDGVAQSAGPTFTLLSLNINATSDVVSDSAPCDWTSETQRVAVVSLMTAHAPDVVALQECDGTAICSMLSSHYDLAGVAGSHRGTCLLLLRKNGPVQATGAAFQIGPCVVVPACVGGRHFYLACIHLLSNNGNDPVRAQQLTALMHVLPPSMPLVFAGDTNMREHETAVHDLGLSDAWAEAGADPAKRYTWNTEVNRYYKDGRQYTARYDRVLLRGCGVLDFDVVANQPCSSNPAHFLSDHFGITATVCLGSTPPKSYSFD